MQDKTSETRAAVMQLIRQGLSVREVARGLAGSVDRGTLRRWAKEEQAPKGVARGMGPR